MFATIHARLYFALVASFCVLGLCLTFAQPVFSLPDEPAHWITANVRLEHFLGKSGCVPTVTGGACPRRKICSTVPPLRLTCSDDIGLYGDIFTYPGVLLSKLLLPRQTESAVRQVQAIVLSRLLQGLIVVLCLLRAGVLAYRTQRIGTLTLAALTLSPLLAQQAFAVSSDGAQLALGLCLFSAVMFWEALTRLDVFLFLLLGYASTAKPTILPLLLPSMLAAYWLAQVDKPEVVGVMGRVRGLLRALKPTRTPSPETLLLWSALALSVLTVAFALHTDAQDTSVTQAEPDLARIAHVQELREHPLRIFALVDSLHYDPRKAAHWVGPLGWLDLRVSPAVLNAFLRMLTLCFGFELARFAWLLGRRESARAGALGRLRLALPGLLLGLLGPVVNVLFMTALMYVLWTPLGVQGARGVQLRYFFPAAMVVIAVGWRTLDVLLARQSERLEPEAPRQLPELSQPAAKLQRWLIVLAPCLVLALSLPYVARLFVDLSIRYHDPSKYPS